MDDLNDPDLRDFDRRAPIFSPADLPGWNVRVPTESIRRWSALSGLAHGLAWAFPFVMFALVLRRYGENGIWPASFFTIGMVLLILFLLRGLVATYTWWFAYTSHELIVEHGLFFKARDHLAFDRVQYLERRSGLVMRAFGLAGLWFDTAAGRAIIPAAQNSDVDEIERLVRTAMLQEDTVL